MTSLNQANYKEYYYNYNDFLFEQYGTNFTEYNHLDEDYFYYILHENTTISKDNTNFQSLISYQCAIIDDIDYKKIFSYELYNNL